MVIVLLRRWKLLGDTQACEYFKQLPQSENWNERAQQNAQSCQEVESPRRSAAVATASNAS